MPAKVFISCGQASDAEQVVARELLTWFRGQGFAPYVATQVLSIPDLNSGIIGELKTSDYYLFINFRREQLSGTTPPLFRGSLYTNQELAIAYALGFDQMLFLNQRGAEREGMFGTIVSNSPEFDRCTEVLAAVQTAVAAARWSPQFSRHLVLDRIQWSPPTLFSDHSIWDGHIVPSRPAKMLHGYFSNRRGDVGASSTVLRLYEVKKSGGTPLPVYDKTPLKVTSYLQQFQQTIWPLSEGCFDLVTLDLQNLNRVFLVSIHDLSPRQPIISAQGTYHLRYQVFAIGFPLLEFAIELQVDGSQNPPHRILP